MAKRSSAPKSPRVRRSRSKRGGAPREIVNERYSGENFERLTTVGTATAEVVKTPEGLLLRMGAPADDPQARLETAIEAPIGGPLSLVSVTVRVNGRRAAKDGASRLDVALEADGNGWQSIALGPKLAEGEVTFTVEGGERFSASSVKLRPAGDGSSAVIEKLEIKASGRPLY